MIACKKKTRAERHVHPMFVASDGKRIVCPVCWRMSCRLFQPLHLLTYSDAERRKLIVDLHAPVDVCGTCKKTRKGCDAAKSLHRDRLGELETDVDFCKDRLSVAKPGKQFAAAKTDLAHAERRLTRFRERRPCRPPTRKTAPGWSQSL